MRKEFVFSIEINCYKGTIRIRIIIRIFYWNMLFSEPLNNFYNSIINLFKLVLH